MTQTAVQPSTSQTTPSLQVWLNGQLVPQHEATVNVFDHGLLYGDGVFEGIRIYNGRIFKLASHVRRLIESADVIRLPIPYSAQQIEQATRDTVEANGLTNGYIRLVVTRGVATLGLHPFKGCEGANVFVIAATIRLYPAELYENGLEVITSSVTRNHPGALSPRIKSLNYLNNILAKIEAIDAGVLEAVMLNTQGFVAECTGDNIFIVRQSSGGPELVTPPLHAGILEGITRNAVIDLARQQGLAVVESDLTKHDLYIADEMFLTGTAAEVIPVTVMDKRSIGDGKPGAITRQLIDAFHALVGENAPED